MSSISKDLPVLTRNSQESTRPGSESPFSIGDSSSAGHSSDALVSTRTARTTLLQPPATSGAVQAPAQESTSRPAQSLVPAAPAGLGGLEAPLSARQAMWKAIDDDDDTALNKALVRMGYDEATKAVDSRNTQGETPLIRAAKAGGVKTTCTLLRYGANALLDVQIKTLGDNQNNSNNKPIASPVYFAAKGNHPEVLDVLVTVGGATFYDAVHLLTEEVPPAIVRAVLDLGANADDFGGAVAAAAERDDAQAIATLATVGGARLSGVYLIAAVEKNAINAAQELLDRGVKVDSVLEAQHSGNVYTTKAKRYTTRRTALDIAAAAGNLDMVKLLMDRKANVPSALLDRAIDDDRIALAVEFLDRRVGTTKSTLAKAAHRGQLRVLAKLIRQDRAGDAKALEEAAVIAESESFPKVASLLHTAAALKKLESQASTSKGEPSSSNNLFSRFTRLGKKKAEPTLDVDDKTRLAKIAASRESTKLDVVRDRLELQLQDAENTKGRDKYDDQLRIGRRPADDLKSLVPYKAR